MAFLVNMKTNVIEFISCY